MAFHSFDQKDFDRWKNGIFHSSLDQAWNVYDPIIRSAVNIFARFNGGRGSYIPPTWQLIKAVIWVESGGPYYSPQAWKSLPMQIGVIIGGQADPGIKDLIKPTTSVSLVTPPDVLRRFTSVGIRGSAELNILAGLALLHSKFAILLKVSPWPTFGDAAQEMGLGLAQVGQALTMVQEGLSHDSRRVYSGSRPVHPGFGSHRRSSPAIGKTTREISRPPTNRVVAWRAFNPVSLYQQYNVGDAAYIPKLEYCLELFRERG